MTKRKVIRNFEMTSEYDLLSRPAAMLVRIAGGFDAEVSLVYRGDTVNAKSLLGILALAIPRGDTVAVVTEGPDAREAMGAIAQLFDCGFEAAPTPRRLFAALSR